MMLGSKAAYQAAHQFYYGDAFCLLRKYDGYTILLFTIKNGYRTLFGRYLWWLLLLPVFNRENVSLIIRDNPQTFLENKSGIRRRIYDIKNKLLTSPKG